MSKDKPKQTVGEILAEIEKKKGYSVSNSSRREIKKIYMPPRNKNIIDHLTGKKHIVGIIIIILITIVYFFIEGIPLK